MGHFSAVFMDQRGTRYVEDVGLLEQAQLLRRGSVIVADNCLKPGSPLFLWHVCKGSAYASQVVRLCEFVMPAEDWMTVTVCCGPPVAGGAGDAGPELHRLERETNQMRERALSFDGDVKFSVWAAFAEALKRSLCKVGIIDTARVRA